MKFKEIVERSQTFAVSAGETLDISKILASAVINSAFKKLGKSSGFDADSVPENFKKFVSLILGEEIGKAPHPKENIIIKFDSKSLPVKELKYEKEGDFVKIILEGKSASPSGLDASNIQVSKEVVPVDLLLLIDPKESEVSGILAKIPHKEVIKIGTRDKNLPLKLAEIIKVLFGGAGEAPSSPENFREALWFLIEEEEKMNLAPSKEGFSALRELWESGVSREKILRAREEIFTAPFNKLLGRALARSHCEKEISTFWSFLPKSDFQKTGAGEWATLSILKALRSLNPQNKFCALLWDSNGVNALIASGDAAKLGELASLFSTSPASSYFSINSFGSFSEAEIKIRSTIAQIINPQGAK